MDIETPDLPRSPRALAAFSWFATLAGPLAIAVGGVTLAGWLLDVPVMRSLWSALVLVGLAPWVRLGNSVGDKDDSIYHASWTSLALESRVVREQGQAPLQARAS